MKRIYAVLIACFAGLTVNATTHTITVADFSFSPAAVTATVGDTIMWVWASGSHTTSSTSVPSGAATWNAPITSSSTSYTYKVTMAGAYAYNCQVHPTQMTGTITVTSSTGITVPTIATVNAYPNPFRDKITIIHDSAADAIFIYNITGEKIASFMLDAVGTRTDLELAHLPAGVYFFSITKEGVIQETRRIVRTN